MHVLRPTAALVLALSLTGCASDSGPVPPGDTLTTDPGASPSPDPSPSEPDPAPGPGIGADLTVALDEGGTGTTTTWTLTCEPPGGDHADPEAACAALAAAGVEAFAPPPRDETCTEQWGGPQVAVVSGTVGETAVQARFSRTNGCEIGRWDALAPLLGSTGGAM